MAAPDLNKLQQILANAEENEFVIGQIRKNMSKVAELIAEVNTMLEPGFKPERKERKPRAASTGTGKRPGRPRKSETPA
jgi:hypothetical protein